MKTQNFKVEKNGVIEHHNIDKAGNHFIDGKCVNPSVQSGLKIGATYPPMEDRIQNNSNEHK